MSALLGYLLAQLPAHRCAVLQCFVDRTRRRGSHWHVARWGHCLP